MKPLRKIAFVVEEFAPRSPSQQLLDRFLVGYPRDGEFHTLADCEILLSAREKSDPSELQARTREFGLKRPANPADAVFGADAIVVVWRGSEAKANHELLEMVLQTARAGARCFVHGTLANDAKAAERFVQLAATRDIALCSGTSTAVTYRLPEIDLPRGARVHEALIVVQGPFGDAELEALNGLLPVLERRHGGEAGIRQTLAFSGQEVWQAGNAGRWSWRLLAAAISRSNTVQGAPLKDGRTQDVVGQGLVPSLATRPRGWLVEHHDDVRTALLVLDGLVADYNFAVRRADGGVVSAQLYRPPPPMQDQFSRLATVLEDFFRTGKAPWPIQRSVVIASSLESFTMESAQRDEPIELPPRPDRPQ
jgi:hypothetical protein